MHHINGWLRSLTIAFSVLAVLTAIALVISAYSIPDVGGDEPPIPMYYPVHNVECKRVVYDFRERRIESQWIQLPINLDANQECWWVWEGNPREGVKLFDEPPWLDCYVIRDARGNIIERSEGCK